MNRYRQGGFSLAELAIVILIMGLVLGGLAMPVAAQRDSARFKETATQIDATKAALEGFALANGFLPCPATPASGGSASAAGGGCTTQHGFVPATTLNLDGPRNADNLLLDPWGSPLRYSVTAADVDGDGNWDFTAPGEMRDVTMAALAPDLVVCQTSTGASASACASGPLTVASAAPLIIYSLGKDWSQSPSADQQENLGATLGGGASGASYPVATNSVFVSRGRSLSSGNEFDDVVAWLSTATLLGRLVDGGQLP